MSAAAPLPYAEVSSDPGVGEAGAVGDARDQVGLVIFDCDGVLVDTEPIAARVSVAVLASMGWEISYEQVLDRFLGCTEQYFTATVEAQLGRHLEEGWDRQFEPLYDAAFDAELAVIEGVVPLLDRLGAAGVPMCVASNGSHAKLRRTLGQTGLRGRFPGRVFSAEDVERGKPAPDLYLHAAQRMGVPPQRCVVVEDSPRGVEAARSARMRCIGYAGLTPPDRLAAPGVTVCRTMADVGEQIHALLPRPA